MFREKHADYDQIFVSLVPYLCLVQWKSFEKIYSVRSLVDFCGLRGTQKIAKSR